MYTDTDSIAIELNGFPCLPPCLRERLTGKIGDLKVEKKFKLFYCIRPKVYFGLDVNQEE